MPLCYPFPRGWWRRSPGENGEASFTSSNGGMSSIDGRLWLIENLRNWVYSRVRVIGDGFRVDPGVSSRGGGRGQQTRGRDSQIPIRSNRWHADLFVA
ncbi:hypothetical protein Tsubulata_016984 [Turnera subulata]|uniref:Uncharacterized protein n=1 Tax=Turnera subulata TaxID=218843 RepID=A0A9Q0JJT3_9ROSI|nr:hypothetical protein Tsubulata_016984 [Turnera subulata]